MENSKFKIGDVVKPSEVYFEKFPNEREIYEAIRLEVVQFIEDDDTPIEVSFSNSALGGLFAEDELELVH